ncbi:MAG: extensin family protein [Pseudolabrys sp.]
MRRGLAFYLIGAAALVALAGCGRGIQFGGERDAWRHDAEVECLKSGALKQNTGVVQISPIEGPGMCGADFPLKVAALGEDAPLIGYADELRPPGAIPGGPERWPIVQQPRYAPPPAPRYEPAAGGYELPGAPMSIVPPSASTPQGYDPRDATVQPLRVPGAPQYQPRGPQYSTPSQDADEDDDIPDDAVVPRHGRVAPPRQSYAPPSAPVAPQRALPRLGPMGSPNMIASKATVTPAATLACPMVSALDQWVREAVQPAAIKWFRQPVVEIKQISAYSCRGMVGSSSGRISEHAFGNALDVAGFVLADGRKILVKNGWKGAPEETGFLHDVQMAACERFSTVLAPGYNAAHHDHMHLDLMRRASGHRACKPYAMTGEEAAVKLSNAKYAHRDPGVTGSIGKNRHKGWPVVVEDDDDADDD